MARELLILIIVVMILAGLAGSIYVISGGGGSEQYVLQGAGSSLAAPQVLYWIIIFKSRYGIDVSYHSVGSGKGVNMFFDNVVDFAGTDPPLRSDIYNAYRGVVLQIPIFATSVVVVYNLPDIQGLNLTGCILAKIYRGLITKWNDPEILALNPSISSLLLDREIIVTYRSDASGTTNIFTLFLHKSCPDIWTRDMVGLNIKGEIINSPSAIGQKGSESVSQFIKNNPYTIGYVDVQYALSLDMSIASLSNPRGEFIYPSPATIESAISNVINKIPSSPLEDWSNVPFELIYVNASNAYPIVTFTFQVFRRDYGDSVKNSLIAEWIRFVLTEGQKTLLKGYYPLPQNLVDQLLSYMGSI